MTIQEFILSSIQRFQLKHLHSKSVFPTIGNVQEAIFIFVFFVDRTHGWTIREKYKQWVCIVGWITMEPGQLQHTTKALASPLFLSNTLKSVCYLKKILCTCTFVLAGFLVYFVDLNFTSEQFQLLKICMMHAWWLWTSQIVKQKNYSWVLRKRKMVLKIMQYHC